MDYKLLLDWFETLSERDVRSLKCLHILCAGRVLHQNWQPSFRQWHVLVTELYSKAFKASQLRWKTQFRTLLWLGSTGTKWNDIQRDAAEEKCLFVRYVLMHLSKTNKLLDLHHPPEELQIKQLFQMGLPHSIYGDPIESMRHLPIPKPLDGLLPLLYSDPTKWYRDYLEQLQRAWAQRKEAVEDAQDNLKAWQTRYGHLLLNRLFDDEDYYRDRLERLGRRRDFRSD